MVAIMTAAKRDGLAPKEEAAPMPFVHTSFFGGRNSITGLL